MSISERLAAKKKGVVPPVTTELDEVVISDSKFVLPKKIRKSNC
jgi:hypothetical protein